MEKPITGTMGRPIIYGNFWKVKMYRGVKEIVTDSNTMYKGRSTRALFSRNNNYMHIVIPQWSSCLTDYTATQLIFIVSTLNICYYALWIIIYAVYIIMYVSKCICTYCLLYTSRCV